MRPPGELCALGACSVAELEPSDWEALESYRLLLKFEARRLLAVVGGQ